MQLPLAPLPDCCFSVSRTMLGWDYAGIGLSRSAGFAFGRFFFALLVILPLAAHLFSSTALSVFSAFYRSGALVFGGGHVVLPLLEDSVVARGWVSQQSFLAGYGAAQALPGPLFTFPHSLARQCAPTLIPSLMAYSGWSLFAPGFSPWRPCCHSGARSAVTDMFGRL